MIEIVARAADDGDPAARREALEDDPRRARAGPSTSGSGVESANRRKRRSTGDVAPEIESGPGSAGREDEEGGALAANMTVGEVVRLGVEAGLRLEAVAAGIFEARMASRSRKAAGVKAK